jgi:hypothetical protein
VLAWAAGFGVGTLRDFLQVVRDIGRSKIRILQALSHPRGVATAIQDCMHPNGQGQVVPPSDLRKDVANCLLRVAIQWPIFDE